MNEFYEKDTITLNYYGSKYTIPLDSLRIYGKIKEDYYKNIHNILDTVIGFHITSEFDKLCSQDKRIKVLNDLKNRFILDSTFELNIEPEICKLNDDETKDECL